MIWIATLCLLAIAAWLIFNGLNEKRWVEAHSHDETVAADTGLFPDVAKMTSSLRADPGGKLSIDQEDTKFARAVTTVREKSGKASDWVENKVTEARSRDDGDTFFGRAVTKVGGVAASLDEKLDARAQNKASERTDRFSMNADGSSGTPSGDGERSGVSRFIERIEHKLGTRTMQTKPSDDPS